MKTWTILFCLLGLSYQSLWAEEFSKETMTKESAHQFGKSLTLEQAVRLILKSSRTLHIARGRVHASGIGEKIKQSAYYPKLSMNASYYDQNRVAKTSTFFEPSPFKNYQYGMRLDYTIYDGQKRKADVELARERKQSSHYQYGDDRRRVIEEVIRTYYEGVALLSRRAQAVRDLKYEEDNLEVANKRIKAGVAGVSERLNFELRIAQAKSNLLEYKTEWQILISRLAALFSVDAKHLSGLEELQFQRLEKDEIDDVDSFIKDAYEERSDLALAQSKIKENIFERKSLRSVNQPSLGVFADYSNTNRERFSTNSQGNAVAFGLQLSLNLFNGFADQNRVLQSKVNEQIAKIQLDNTYIRIKAEIEALYLSALRWRGRRTLDKRALELAQKKRDLVYKEYLAGTQDVLHLNQAQNDLSQAETKYELSEIQYVMALELLKNASSNK